MTHTPHGAGHGLTLRDFPDRLPAMLVKELRQGMRAPLFLAPFGAVHVLVLLALAIEYRAGGMGGLQSPFWGVTAGVVALLMPLRGFAALREELEAGNAALLMLGGLSRWDIVRGKWLVQVVLCGLTFVSLLPYLLVRYFLGGFELIPNLLMAVNVLTVSAGVSGCLIGASGYRPVTLRFLTAGIGLFWVIGSGVAAGVFLARMPGLSGAGQWLQFGYGYGCSLGIQVLYAVTGLQLGRAHLKLYLLPGERPPARTVVSMLIFLPFILLAGGIATIGYGFPAVLMIVIIAMCRFDRPWQPQGGRKSPPAPGMDSGPHSHF